MNSANQQAAITLPVSIEKKLYAKRFRLPDRMVGGLIPLLALVLWEVLSRIGVLPSNWFPAPSIVVRTICDLVASGELWGHLAATLWRIAVGFGVGALLGTLLGGLTGTLPTLRRLLDPTIHALRNIPSMAWAPLFLLWLGIQEGSKIALIALGAFIPVYLNLTSAIIQVDRKLIEVGRIYRLSRLQMFRRIMLPAALPTYFVGLRSGLGLAWMFVVAAEIMGASRGLGFLMIDGQMTGRASVILASVILFAILGKLSDWLLESLGKRLLPHQASGN